MELTAIHALRAALLENHALNQAVSGQVYWDDAPASATYPYIVISLNSGGAVNDAALRMADLHYLVKCVGTNKTATVQIADLIYQTLHEADLIGDDAWYIWRCQQVSVVSYSEMEAEVRYTHSGGIYRIRMSS